MVSRISFPSASSAREGTSSDNTLLRKEDSTSGGFQDRAELRSDELEVREETYVITTACDALTVMCRTAGDFMATRVENEFPRWERLFRRAWDKVRQDAERSLNRRAAAHQAPKPSPGASGTTGKDLDTQLSLVFAQSLSLTTSTKSALARSVTSTFTPHHSLWRSLTTLFITILTHVRLPLSIGDQICEFLGAWIARYAGPEYYFLQYCSQRSTAPRIPKSLQIEVTAVDDVIRAMETWNADLAWFIFQQQRRRVLEVVNGRKERAGLVDTKTAGGPGVVGAGRLRFAEIVF